MAQPIMADVIMIVIVIVIVIVFASVIVAALVIRNEIRRASGSGACSNYRPLSAAGCLIAHGVDHAHDVVPVPERGHDHGGDHEHDHVHDHVHASVSCFLGTGTKRSK